MTMEYRLIDDTGRVVLDGLDHRQALRFHRMLSHTLDQQGRFLHPGLRVQSRTVGEWRDE